MKKLFVILLALTLLLSMSALAMAADPDTAVSSEDEDYVGKDVELAEGEMGITALPEPADADAEIIEMEPIKAEVAEDEDFVGRDMVLEEGEAGITSVVGDDIAIGEGEFKIISYTPEQTPQDARNYLIFGILIIVTAGIVLLAKKKAHSKA